jgi:hypothetical protein
MPGYVITAVFEVAGGKIRLGRDVLAPGWGPGHRFSYCDGRMLTLVAEVRAPEPGYAFELMLSRAEQLWVDLGAEPLPPPETLRVQTVVPEEKVVAGAVGRGPDRFIAESAAKVAARLRATRAALADLEGQLWPWSGGPDGPREGGDEPPDDGGLAGVREPLRPGPGPGPSAEALQEPRSLPEVEALLPQR